MIRIYTPLGFSVQEQLGLLQRSKRLLSEGKIKLEARVPLSFIALAFNVGPVF